MRRASLIAAIVLALAGCGGDGDEAAQTTTPAPSSSEQSNGHALAVGDTDIGDVVVNASGRTLYMFTKDSGAKSSCSGDCAKQWPPAVLGGNSMSGPGIDRRKFSSIAGPAGSRQLTYGGHPLYTFAGDESAGELNGQGSDAFGGKWYALSPSGEPIEDQTQDEEKPSGGGGGGYGY
jgi:predicted lipoprotein with Yx(FWY)xxD motif